MGSENSQIVAPRRAGIGPSRTFYRAAGGLALSALMLLVARPSNAQYSVQLQVDATSGTESYQTNILPQTLTSISANQTANSSTAGPPSGSGSASSAFTAAMGSLDGSATGTGTGDGGGTAIAEGGFSDTVTLSVGQYTIGFVPGGGASASGGLNTSSTAFTELSFEAAPLTAAGNVWNIAQNVCAKESNGSALSCGGGWQSAPTALSTTLDVTTAGSYSLTGYFTAEATVSGGAVPYVCGNETCYQYYSATGDAGDAGNSFYITGLTTGATVSSASGWSYAAPSTVPLPASWALMLSGLGGLAWLARRRFDLAAQGGQ